MNRWEIETVDGRTQEEILKEILNRAKGYTPEWEFSEKNPDAGSVFALIFARQMEQNVKKADRALNRYHMELVNMLGLAPRPAVPARSVIVMTLNSDTVDGTAVKAGTRFLAEGEEGKKLVFETCGDIYVSNIRLKELLGISGRLAKAVTYLEDGMLNKPAALFDYSGQPIGDNGVLICHPSMFDVPGGSVYFLAEGNLPAPELAKVLSSPDRFEFFCSCGDRFARIKVQDMKDGRLRLFLDKGTEKLAAGGVNDGAIYIKSVKPVKETITVNRIALSGERQEEKPELLAGENGELVGENVRPFGNKIELYDEFYVGSSRIFSKKGALVCVEFNLSWEEKIYSLESEIKTPDLKPIKRKKNRGTPDSVFYRTAAAEVSAEYFNGVGWKKIPFQEDWNGLFDGTVSGPVKLFFHCPGDWKETAEAGYEGLIIRFKIVRADNCYLMPCIHTIPVMSKWSISCSHEGIWEEPSKVVVCSGTKRREVDLKKELGEGRGFPAFCPFPYEEDFVLFGFDGSFDEGPICLFLQIQEPGGRKPGKLVCEYSSRSGFKELQVIDHTQGLSVSGTLTFLPPSDMAEFTVMGRECYWLRMKDLNRKYAAKEKQNPILEGILINAVEAENVETGMEESYFLEEAYEGGEIFLGNRMILDVRICVNERSALTGPEKERMLLEEPDRVRAEYDYLGEISAFFVQWEEVENFRSSGPEDRHYRLDRRRGTLQFGNGVKGKAPGEKQGTAYTVKARFCDGEAGNVAEGAISMMERTQIFIGTVYNPAPASGGGNIESPEQLCARGEAGLSSLGRLVSQTDYMREVLSYSSGIAQAAMVVGRAVTGEIREDLVSVVLLMRDYKEGSDSFERLKGPLGEYLLKRCDGCINKENFCITKPLMIRIGVEVWACLKSGDQPLEVREKLLEALRTFLEPVPDRIKKGREIGSLPKKNQITAMLHSVRFLGHLTHVTACAVYHDGTGRHEVDLDDLGEQPFGVGMNGEHKIHLIVAEGE